MPPAPPALDTFMVVIGVIQAILFMWLGWITARIAQLSRESKDIHNWHKPDDQGMQTWKNPLLSDAIDENTAAIKALHEEFRGMRDDFRNLASATETRAKREELIFENLVAKLGDLKSALEKVTSK